MRLQTVSLFGFKSFADRTEIEILPGITAIVGPNGCGKTNIADALRWALGEQSPKALRGQRMEDVIFHGSSSRRPLGLAEALLNFENDGALSVPWSEVSVGRRLYRDGESEYLLNKTPCRLRDVHDLFLGTGVNPRAYALMEQERLAHILTAKPADRRVFIEEAAGITRYKQQRAETLGKIEATRQNLLRVRDVMDEVRRQLGSLERQARRAKQYKALQAERRTLELQVSAAAHAALVAEVAELETREAAERERVEVLRTRVAQLAAQQELSRAEAMEAERRVAEARLARERAELELQGCVAHAEQLRRQAEDLAEEQTRLERETDALAARIRAIGEERAAKHAQAAAFRHEFAAAEARAREAESALDGLRARLRAARDEAEGLRQEQVALAGRRTELGQMLGALDERREQLARRLERLRTEQGEAAAEAARVAEGRAATEARLQTATARLGELQHALGQVADALFATTAERAAAAREAEECRVALAGHRSSLATLEELEAQRAGYGHGVQAVMAAANAARLPGVLGTVADLLEVPAGLERAVEAALGERLQWVVVDTVASAKRALAYLGQNGGGQATFLPLDWLNGGAKGHIPTDAGVVGPAGTLVGSSHARLVENLLGSVVIVRDLDAAEQLWSRNGADTSFVTVSGEVVAPPGALGGGRATGGADTSLLARKRAILDLRARIAEEEGVLEVAVGRAREAEARIAGLGDEQRRATTEREATEAERLSASKDLERLREEAERAALFGDALRSEAAALGMEVEAAGEELSRYRAELGDVEARTATVRTALARLAAVVESDEAAEAERAQAFLDAQVELAGLAGRIEGARSEAERLGTEQGEAQARIEEGRERLGGVAVRLAEGWAERARLDAQAERIRGERNAAEAAEREAVEVREALTERTRALGDEARAAELELSRASHHLGELTVRAAEVRVRRQDLEADARRQFEVGVDELRAAHDPARDPDAVRGRLDELRAKIAALEPVNLIADEEYRELEERLTFLQSQHEDLTASIRDLDKALRGMTRTAQARFTEAFEAINRNFQELFTRLFEGGRAELRLVESPEDGDPLETGIEMVAQPRGKRLQAISLLSGGEKALTGLALLFAIFYYRPSPFCLLDEVDAPLDDANINRFTRVLRELAGQTQFVVITHNRKTMEAADVLYGVTMEEPGLSRIVSVNLA